MTKGFAMDDERLKDSTKFGKDYFDEVITLEQFVHLKKILVNYYLGEKMILKNNIKFQLLLFT